MAHAAHKIELLGEGLLDAHPDLAMDVLGASSRLALALGWHYVLDLVWVLRELEQAPPRASEPPLNVLEVGAGFGLLQFLLADRGYDVTSADMRARTPDDRLLACYDFETLGSSGEIEHPYLDHLSDPSGPGSKRGSAEPGRLGPQKARAYSWLPTRAANLLDQLGVRSALSGKRASAQPNGPARPADLPPKPRIRLYHCDAETMPALADDSIDASFSISALEHNPPERIRSVQREIERVTRPGGFCLHTLSGVRKGTTFHEPSHSHLMDDVAMAETFGLESYASNWAEWDRYEADLQRPGRLARWLAYTYWRSGRNGMPWGVWQPAYLPVGLRKEL